LIRAAQTGNLTLLKEILTSRNILSDLAEKWGPETSDNFFSLIFKNNREDFLRLYLEFEKRGISFSRNPTQSQFQKTYTGYNDKYAYGVIY
jgi:hypothetical protein